MGTRPWYALAALAGLAVAIDAGRAGAEDAMAALLARTDRVSKEVAQVRGLRLKKPIANEVVDDAELRRRLLARAAEPDTYRETAAEGLALERWGMIPPGTDYPALVIDLLAEQIAGYYDPKTNRLTIARSVVANGPAAEMVLAHEIDHGLQDQHFDLEKFQDVAARAGDAALARRALVEGDGVALMIEVMLAREGSAAPWSNPDVAKVIDKAMGVPGHDKLDRAPLAVRETMLFPYRAGLGFVAHLRRRQPWRAIDAAFKKPPASTEHILHPERYLAGDAPVEVRLSTPKALSEHVLAHDTVWGEHRFALFLRAQGIDANAAMQAADGWGGDRVLTLAPAGVARASDATGVAKLRWDSEVDAIEAAEAVSKALDRIHVGATSTIDGATSKGRWVARDGGVSWFERRGVDLVVVLAAPAGAAEELSRQLWDAAPAGATRAVPAGR